MKADKRTQLSVMLEALDMTPRDLVRLLRALGDPAPQATVRRRVTRWLAGTAALPGEMVAFLTLLSRVRGASRSLVEVFRLLDS